MSSPESIINEQRYVLSDIGVKAPTEVPKSAHNERHRLTVEDLTANNNGGSTDYYKFEPDWVECSDVIEARHMNYNQGNIFKASFCFNTGRHAGTTAERELNKIIYFAQRELNLLKGK